MQVKRQSIAHNTGWLSGVNLLIKPLSFVFIILATRLLGPDDFGKFAFTTSIVSFIYVFFEGGINIHTVRSISADKDNFDNNFYLQLFLKAGGGLLTGIAAIIFLLFTNYESTIVYLTLIAIIFIIFNALMLHLRMYFRAFEVMKYESYSIAFEKFGLILICGSLLFISQNVVLFTAFYAITYFITFLYTLVLLIKVIGRPKFHFPLSRIYNDVIVPASPFALMNILITGRASAGTLLLKFIKQKDTSVGYYSAPYRLLSSFLLFPNMITKPLLPVIVRIQERMRYVKRLLNSTARFLLGIAALVAFPLFLLHKPITILLFGPSFAPAATTLSIIA
ncbi:MAG TPA: oligosaccharide flippase family protein, partial [Balneolales bacterium]|nr:oligosaccharide flippase family protein [Balneolales bacterium]